VIDPQLLADIRFFELLDQEDRQQHTGPRTATAIALEDTNLIVLSKDSILHFVRKKPVQGFELSAVSV